MSKIAIKSSPNIIPEKQDMYNEAQMVQVCSSVLLSRSTLKPRNCRVKRPSVDLLGTAFGLELLLVEKDSPLSSNCCWSRGFCLLSVHAELGSFLPLLVAKGRSAFVGDTSVPSSRLTSVGDGSRRTKGLSISIEL
jgi:hypothetical protein